MRISLFSSIVNQNHSQYDAAEYTNCCKCYANAHRVVPVTGILDNISDGCGVAVPGIEPPDAHVAELIGQGNKQTEHRGNSQSQKHLGLMAETGQKRGCHPVPSDLIEFQPEEHGGADKYYKGSRPLADSAAERNVNRRYGAKPARSKKHTDSSCYKRRRNKIFLKNSDTPSKLKPDQQQCAEIGKIL